MKRIWIWSISALFLLSCTKDPVKDLTAEESRIYITNYDTTVSFSNYTTFRIADSVAVVVNNQLKSRERADGDAQLINAIANALQERGYTRVTNQNADLGVTISSITNTSTQLVSYTDYGGYYGSYWDPFYWGFNDYSYYFPTYYGVYETGETALAIDMVDLKNAASNNNQLRGVWSGLVRGPGIFSSRNVESHVNALFNQSTYLKR
jgi:hypothetical protein